LLGRFPCSTGPWFEREVEDYIQTRVSAQVRQGRRVLLLEDGGELIGVGAHEAMPDPEGADFLISWLELVAIHRERQGTSLPTGERLATVLLTALMRDGLSDKNRQPFVAAYVAQENTRSRTLCSRVGLTEDPTPVMLFCPILGAEAPYVFLQGSFRRHPGPSSSS